MIGIPVLMLLAAAAFGGDGDRFDGPVLPAAQRATKTFEIAINGSPGVKVVVACLVDWGDEVDVVTLKGEVPQTRKVEAVGVQLPDQEARIAAVVLGGAALQGGEGMLYKSVIGVFIMIVLGNALNLLNVDSYWQRVAVGAVIIAAAAAERLRSSRSQ